MPTPICPTCGEEAMEQQTRYGIRHVCCGLHSWGGKPLASPATHEARRAAHDAFDTLWMFGKMKRSRAYALLVEELDIPAKECHMALMDEETARRVPPAVERIKAQRGV
jgi:hypothetical protein